jgi:hypothetical protein
MGDSVATAALFPLNDPMEGPVCQSTCRLSECHLCEPARTPVASGTAPYLSEAEKLFRTRTYVHFLRSLFSGNQMISAWLQRHQTGHKMRLQVRDMDAALEEALNLLLEVERAGVFAFRRTDQTSRRAEEAQSL